MISPRSSKGSRTLLSALRQGRSESFWKTKEILRDCTDRLPLTGVDPCNQVEERRLAATRRSQERDKLLPFHGKRDRIDDRLVLVAESEARCLNGQVRTHSTPSFSHPDCTVGNGIAPFPPWMSLHRIGLQGLRAVTAGREILPASKEKADLNFRKSGGNVKDRRGRGGTRRDDVARSFVVSLIGMEMHIAANTSFYNLSPDIIMEAAEQGGLRPTGYCMALNSYENRVYELVQEDGSHVVAKFYRPGRWTRDQIREEHELLFELRDEEIPVCAPLILTGGESIREISGMYYAVWPRTGGRAPGRAVRRGAWHDGEAPGQDPQQGSGTKGGTPARADRARRTGSIRWLSWKAVAFSRSSGREVPNSRQRRCRVVRDAPKRGPRSSNPRGLSPGEYPSGERRLVFPGFRRLPDWPRGPGRVDARAGARRGGDAATDDLPGGVPGSSGSSRIPGCASWSPYGPCGSSAMQPGSRKGGRIACFPRSFRISERPSTGKRKHGTSKPRWSIHTRTRRTSLSGSNDRENTSKRKS